MRTVVIFKSKTGFAEKYGRWIAAKLGCEAIKAEKVNDSVLDNYDVIIYGGGIYAGQINGLKNFKKLIQAGKRKTFIVFATGAAPLEEREAIEKVKNSNFTDEEQKSIPFYYLQGGIDYEKMSLPNKLIMKAVGSSIDKEMNKNLNNSEKAVSIKVSHDISSEKFIEPLTSYVAAL